MDVTLKDAQIIKAALLERLEQSLLADRDDLILSTSYVRPSISDGTIRIGNWVLFVKNERDLTLAYRGPFGAAGAFFYSAAVLKEGDKWLVKGVASGVIHLRR